jgi:hypothetical protein
MARSDFTGRRGTTLFTASSVNGLEQQINTNSQIQFAAVTVICPTADFVILRMIAGKSGTSLKGFDDLQNVNSSYTARIQPIYSPYTDRIQPVYRPYTDLYSRRFQFTRTGLVKHRAVALINHFPSGR